MDNYTLSIPLLFGILFGYIHHFNHLYVSNTKMIIRQSDQIQFLLTRIIELENKINKLKSDSDIAVDDFLDTIDEDIVTKEVVLKEDEDNVLKEDEDNVLKEDEDIVTKEVVEENEKEDKDFELVETSSTFKINKNKGWLQYIF